VIGAFGQEKSPIRILIASDMASEGLNLHYQCHRLIHFDLPWSLLRFQQRNGRIDRYGQDRPPLITYFVGESTHPKVRQMWVLEKLVEKDEAAQSGVGDPAVFLGKGDADEEEAVVAEAVSAGIGADAWFCDPQAPYQKGTVENTNNRLRKYLPRSTEPTALTNRYLRSICHRLNSTPRKCLGYHTPAEIFETKLMEIQNRLE